MLPFIGDISFIGLIIFIVLAIKAKKKQTGKARSMWMYAVGCLVVLVICFALDPGSLQTASVSQKQATKAIETAKPVKQTINTVKSNLVKNKSVSSVNSPVSDQYLEDFLGFMDKLNSDLQLAVQQDPNPSVIAKIITNANVEGWKRYGKLNTPPSKESEDQFNKRYDVLMAWESMFNLDMEYNSYIMHDGNASLKTTNNKEKIFSNDYNKAKSHFPNYPN